MMDLSEKILKFHCFFRAFVAYIDTHATDLLISSEQVDKLDALYEDWLVKYEAYITPNTHGFPSISDIKVAYVACSGLTDTLRTQIRDNSDIQLSGEAQLNLNIVRTDKSRSSILPLDYAPSLALVSVTNWAVEVFVMDPKHPIKRAKPKNVKLIGLMIAYTDTPQPPNDEAYKVMNPEGKTTFSILFTNDKLGKYMWIVCWYMTATGKPSPASKPLMVKLGQVNQAI